MFLACSPLIKNEYLQVYTMCQQCCCPTCCWHPSTCYTPPICPCVPPTNWTCGCPDACRDEYLASVSIKGWIYDNTARFDNGRGWLPVWICMSLDRRPGIRLSNAVSTLTFSDSDSFGEQVCYLNGGLYECYHKSV